MQQTITKPRRKMLLCLDFDGVIHSYEKGWGTGEIYGSVTEGFWPWLEGALKIFDVTIYSTRSRTSEGRNAMADWLHASYVAWLSSQGRPESARMLPFAFAHEKPPAFLTIDDRALTFTGHWGDFAPERLARFKPWTELKKKGIL